LPFRARRLKRQRMHAAVATLAVTSALRS
jgi:hypothetical protein